MFGISNKAMVEHSFCFIFFLLRIENDYIITESQIEYIYMHWDIYCNAWPMGTGLNIHYSCNFIKIEYCNSVFCSKIKQ